MKNKVYKLQGNPDVFIVRATKDKILDYWARGIQLLFEHKGELCTYKGGSLNITEVNLVYAWVSDEYDVYLVGSDVVFKTKMETISYLPTCMAPKSDVQVYLVSDLDLDGVTDRGTCATLLNTSVGLERSSAFAG